jgi:poly-beta-1,6-N-acetyl-D-glucosamine biosynthesis protein PgaD
MVVRDVVLTLLMWGMLALILWTEAELIWNAVEVLMRKPDAVIDAELELFAQKMRPLIALMLTLVALLAVATLISRHRRDLALGRPQPPSLPGRQLAKRAGLPPEALEAARQHRIVVVTILDDGSLRVDAAGAGPG